MSNYVVLKAGGKLERHYYNFSEKIKDVDDVTEFALRSLMSRCVLDEDVTLKDVFILMQQDIDVYKVIVNNWVEEIIAEGFSQNGNLKDDEIEYLELHWCQDIRINDSGKRVFDREICPRFRGVGKAIEVGNGGSTTYYAVDFAKVYDIINLPLKLNSNVQCTDWSAKNSTPKIIEYEDAEFTLLDIIYGIIYDLSFYGSPSSRDSEVEKLHEIIKRIDSGEEKLYDMEEVLGRLKSSLGEQ